MDGSSGYNQIWINPKDEELTSFRTRKGIYYYKVIPFRLKNVGTIYLQAKQKIIDNMLHKYVECYMDISLLKQNNITIIYKTYEMLSKYSNDIN